jgi:hypothetical protein
MPEECSDVISCSSSKSASKQFAGLACVELTQLKSEKGELVDWLASLIVFAPA